MPHAPTIPAPRHPVPWLALLLLGLSCLLPAADPADQDQRPNAIAFRQMRHGLFVHQVWGLTGWADGRKGATLDQFTDAFDVPAFADQMAGIGVEYVFFTAWHKAMYLLGPSRALEKWLPGHTARRDLIGELADALQARNIKLVIYAHPNDGHDLTREERIKVGYVDFAKDDPERNRVLNDFINEVFAELSERYARKPNVLGFWWDSWYHNGARIDMWRLHKTVRDRFPGALLLSNYSNAKLDPNFIDMLSLERSYKGTRSGNLDELRAENLNQCFPLMSSWWSSRTDDRTGLSAESLYRFLLLTVGCGAPGGVAWDASPLADGRTWPSGNQVLEVLGGLNRHLAPVRPTVCGVLPSRNWPLKPGTVWSKAPAFVAARSPGGDVEWIHVLKPPAGRTIELPRPRETFSAACLYLTKKAVALDVGTEVLRLTLPEDAAWSELDTVITLTLAPAGR